MNNVFVHFNRNLDIVVEFDQTVVVLRDNDHLSAIKNPVIDHINTLIRVAFENEDIELEDCLSRQVSEIEFSLVLHAQKLMREHKPKLL